MQPTLYFNEFLYWIQYSTSPSNVSIVKVDDKGYHLQVFQKTILKVDYQV